jgi:hypothetical protein
LHRRTPMTTSLFLDAALRMIGAAVVAVPITAGFVALGALTYRRVRRLQSKAVLQ